MVASAVSVHDGMTLDALAAAAKSADIRICLTVTEHFGWNGLGDTIGFRMLPLKFSLAHEPHLRYQFAPIGTHGAMGRPYVMTPRQLRAALTSRLPARCHQPEMLN